MLRSLGGVGDLQQHCSRFQGAMYDVQFWWLVRLISEGRQNVKGKMLGVRWPDMTACASAFWYWYPCCQQAPQLLVKLVSTLTCFPKIDSSLHDTIHVYMT